jgi:Fe/S biogenesis protein NfuA
MTSLTETTETSVLEITERALTQIIALRNAETIPGLTLGVRIAGVGHQGFLYETAFLKPEDVDEGDHLEYHGELPVAIPPDSLDNLRGSVLDLVGEPDAPGLVLRNPNPPSPAGGPDIPDMELTGTVEEKVRQLLDQAINPAIASHGGVARLDRVEDGTAFLELGGGCQGCGLAAMTLRQGIETAIRDNIPEITEIVDVTDHAGGENPFYA